MAATTEQTLLVGDMQALAKWAAEMPPMRNSRGADALCETIGTAMQAMADEDDAVAEAYTAQLEESENNDEGTDEFWDAVLARI